MSIGITDDNDGLEAGTLTGTGLLLDWLDLLRKGELAIGSSIVAKKFGRFWS